jgi:hypothetical protein
MQEGFLQHQERSKNNYPIIVDNACAYRIANVIAEKKRLFFNRETEDFGTQNCGVPVHRTRKCCHHKKILFALS